MYIWKNISASLRRKKNDVQALLYSTWKEQYGWFIEERLISININISINISIYRRKIASMPRIMKFEGV